MQYQNLEIHSKAREIARNHLGQLRDLAAVIKQSNPDINEEECFSELLKSLCKGFSEEVSKLVGPIMTAKLFDPFVK